MRKFMRSADAISAPLAECYITIDGNRYFFMQAINLEANLNFPSLARPARATRPAVGRERAAQHSITTPVFFVS